MELPADLMEKARAIAGDWTVDTGEEARLATSIAELALAERLSATERAAKTRVKQLDWTLVDDDWWGAESTVGCYEVRQARASVRVRFDTGKMEPFEGTIDEAKAAFQADFERRILAALQP